MTPFSLLCGICGLSTREAAAFHGVRHDTTLSWSSGRRSPPPAVLEDLVRLAEVIKADAARQIAHLQAKLAETRAADRMPAFIELGYAAADHEAQLLGLPCVGAHAALLGLIIAGLIRDGTVPASALRLVPRGATAATAPAADLHEGVFRKGQETTSRGTRSEAGSAGA
jgi:hypothetical protein